MLLRGSNYIYIYIYISSSSYIGSTLSFASSMLLVITPMNRFRIMKLDKKMYTMKNTEIHTVNAEGEGKGEAEGKGEGEGKAE